MKKFKVIISETARNDMLAILNYCCLSYSLSYALKVYSLLLQNIYSLSIFPNSNPLYSVTLTSLLRKRVVLKKYLIVFKVIANSVIILGVYDGRRNISPNNFMSN